ncbi:hypothetical protein ACG7TL_005572 [Trametes sanguinea]
MDAPLWHHHRVHVDSTENLTLHVNWGAGTPRTAALGSTNDTQYGALTTNDVAPQSTSGDCPSVWSESGNRPGHYLPLWAPRPAVAPSRELTDNYLDWQLRGSLVVDPQTSIEHLVPVGRCAQETSTDTANIPQDATLVTAPLHPLFNWAMPQGAPAESPAVTEASPLPPPVLPLDQVLALAQAVSDQISTAGNSAPAQTDVPAPPSAGQTVSAPALNAPSSEFSAAEGLLLDYLFGDLFAAPPLATNATTQTTPVAPSNMPGPLDISPLIGAQEHIDTPAYSTPPTPADNSDSKGHASQTRSGPSRTPSRTRRTTRYVPYNAPSPAAPSPLDSPDPDSGLNEFRCPHCEYVQRARRRVDLERHMALHAPLRARRRFPCCGIPLALIPSFDTTGMKTTTVRCALPGDGTRWVELEMVGGCGGLFSRADALKRHLDDKGCLGDHRGPWLEGVWEAMRAEGLEEYFAAH